MFQYKVIFQDGSTFMLEGKAYYHDKRVFWVAHINRVNSFCEVYYERGLPVEIMDMDNLDTFHVKDYETFCAWFRQYQSVEFVDIFRDTNTEQDFRLIGQQAMDKAKAKLEHLSSFTPSEDYMKWHAYQDIQWLEGHVGSLLAAIGRERRTGNIRADCLDKLESCFLALKEAPTGYPMGVMDYYHKNPQQQSGQHLRALYTQHLAALLAAEEAFKSTSC